MDEDGNRTPSQATVLDAFDHPGETFGGVRRIEKNPFASRDELYHLNRCRIRDGVTLADETIDQADWRVALAQPEAERAICGALILAELLLEIVDAVTDRDTHDAPVVALEQRP